MIGVAADRRAHRAEGVVGRQFTTTTQQPVRQYEPSPHGLVSSHTGRPGGHEGSTHPGGSVVLPAQSSHSSHAFSQLGTGVQRRHFVGSSRVWLVQLAVRRTESVLPARSKVQHPKQSHPFGVMGKQRSRHRTL